MLVNFISKIKQNGEEKTIDFKSPIQISEDFGFKVYEFEEPQMKQMNRIEVNDKYVNIFAGSSTLNLELKKQITVRYRVDSQIINLVTTMTSLKQDGEDVEFKYTIKTPNGELIGSYHLMLKIEK